MVGLQLSNPELASALRPLGIEFFYFGIASVVVVLLTGMGRTFTYIENYLPFLLWNRNIRPITAMMGIATVGNSGIPFSGIPDVCGIPGPPGS